ncbi:UDP-3-O-[3-hydroxymyristoyl] glucosamine N-acyltransferase [Chitinophaga ginsengisegetis]|uniref:UDP-3-O-acylglucosamine N-acyltransferase n=1 Tax=Chitinophaga ginsengisegetis TaxID=393003 RepID=A0A1T5PCD8_9BACT|nr:MULTISPECIES: UDP-3-O-(3-hydroxymyristoyl)glucosamine N-acyltransferase [Chitinophaga]MDR6570221.1 UDP-3-O-[3-hydroxymyristoyl] glucosamine N-acyltransferase [Chitinophaga ginsengisegetis]MDR6649955.1 UDP-3-O-[3-hydroxymyristoyl] glucosamine N-acyltransferase [Chitinophaga ginsengisegetis]MDR6656404.1 UDP-3-O-[3-hydroxymyristoyl] glucosamine N-acyltransferase [Chitinophaga ginsengisegetis]SKD10405.1 UDP-3-O-[3-hydroxymyristoyl] glucosamine N-acyltransferase [Chitinophaga ginsengisegetis]
MQFSALQLATMLDGKLEGNPDVKVSNIAKIEEAGEGMLSFIANPKYEEFIYTTNASILIVNESLVIERPIKSTLIRVKDAYSSFALLLEQYRYLTGNKSGIQQPSYIPASVKMGENVFVGAFAYLGENVVLGNNVKIYPGVYLGDNVIVNNDSILYPGVKVYDNCIVGSRVMLHAGCVIGGDGFGFAPQPDGSYKKVPQIGNVVIHDDVEIGANTTIDRATMGSTVIRKGVKLDNLIQVAHNVDIGINTVIAAQTGVSGSTKIGQNCVIGGQVGMVGHIHIADNTKINAQSGLSKSITVPNTSLTGSPAYDYKSSLKSQAIFRNLPDLEKRVKELEEMVKQLLQERAGV